MKILAIDPANITGWSVGVILSGVFHCKGKSKESPGLKFVKFRKYIKDIINDEGIDIVVYEKPGGRFFGGVRSHANFEGVLLQLLEELGINFKAYSAGEIKKHAKQQYTEKFQVPLKGQMNKDLMVMTAGKFFDREIIDDNHADSLWLHHLAQTEFE